MALKKHRPTTPSQRFVTGPTFEEITRKFEKDLINKVLEESSGNKVKAAKILYMNRKTVYRKMKSLGL
jgi:DNA-binding NtrC family response regulator